MQAGIGSYAFRYAIGHHALKPEERMSFQDLIGFCAENQVEALQVCENIPLHLLTDEQLSDGLSMLQKHSITFELGTTGFAPDHLTKYSILAKNLGSKILRTVLNAKNETIDNIALKLQCVIPDFERQNITLAIENHFDLTAYELRELVEKVNHPLVKVCIDPLNSITLLNGINETFEQLKDHIVSAHVKDVKIERIGSGFHITGCPLGEGHSRVDDYLRKVYGVNPSCNVFVEQWMDSCASTDDTLALEKEWVLHGVQYLKNSIGNFQNLADG